jgi:elongation factor G
LTETRENDKRIESMKRYEAKDVRDLVLLGHSGSGKTSLGEAILFCGKVTTRLGSVDDNSSNLDSEPEEHKRRITIHSALGFCEWKKTKVNFLDTPGDPNFVVDTRLAAAVADAAVVVVSAPDGVQVGTEKGWRIAEEFALPRAIFLCKMDRERADFETALENCRKNLSEKAAALQIPIGREAGFEGVVDLLAMKAWRFGADGREPAAGEIPPDLREAAARARDQLVEAIAATDDKLIEKYLESGELSEAEIQAGLARGIVSGSLVPVLMGSAARNVGIQPLLDLIVAVFPSPVERAPRKGAVKDAEVERKAEEGAPFSAVVFKTIGADVGRMNLMRVVSGVLRADSTVYNPARQSRERIGQIYVLVGKKRETVAEAGPGDLVALAKLKDTRTGDTLCDEKDAVVFKLPAPPHPVISFAIAPKSKGDEDKVASKLAEITEEDPGLQIVRDQASKEILLSGLGQVHIEATVDKLRRLGVEVDLLPPKVPYRETVKGKAHNVEGKHKKQTGGRGQFAVCYIHLEPMPRGSGFEFADEIFGGSIPRQFIPAVEKGIRDRMTRGVIAGCPVVDVRVRLVDGKYHDVDSDSRSFEIAGSKGFQLAFKQAKPILLEPMMSLEVTCPDDSMGDVMGYVNQRRGRVLGMDSRDRSQIVRAQAPMSEVLRCATEIHSITGGRGSVSMAFSHYDEVPGHLTDKIVAEAKVAAEEED